MSNLPDYLSSGESARLIPVAPDSKKEGRAVSVFLSIIESVDLFAKALMSSIGQRVGTRSKIECFTEVVFKKSPDGLKIRPDGLLIFTVGSRSWSAIIEAKIGNSRLDEGQVLKYCELAKLNGINAIVTLSNQFAALPTHHPLKLNKRKTGGVELYHWSWMYIMTQAHLTLNDNDFISPEQRYLLDEMLRYFDHKSVPVSSFDRMNPEWKDLVMKVQTGATLNKDAPEVKNSVAAWHEEQRDICLFLSREVGRHVTLRLSRKHAENPELRLQEDCLKLVDKSKLECVLEIPDAASPMSIVVDVSRRTVACGMSLTAPKDKKRSQSRVNWLLGQLSKTNDPEEIHIKVIWPGRANDTQAKLSDLRNNPELLLSENNSLLPQHFEVFLNRDLAGKFSGAKTFIEHFESAIPKFYKQVGQHLRNWVAPPPKIISKSDESKIEEAPVNEAIIEKSKPSEKILEVSNEEGELDPSQDTDSPDKISASNDIEPESPQVESPNRNEGFESDEN